MWYTEKRDHHEHHSDLEHLPSRPTLWQLTHLPQKHQDKLTPLEPLSLAPHTGPDWPQNASLSSLFHLHVDLKWKTWVNPAANPDTTVRTSWLSLLYIFYNHAYYCVINVHDSIRSVKATWWRVKVTISSEDVVTVYVNQPHHLALFIAYRQNLATECPSWRSNVKTETGRPEGLEKMLFFRMNNK